MQSMHAASDAPTRRQRGEMDASQTRQDPPKVHGEENISEWLSTLISNLKIVKESLEKGETGPETVKKATEALASAEQARRSLPEKGSLEERLGRIEELLRKPPQAADNQSKTWAKIAAGGMRQAGEPPAILPERHTVRVQMPAAKGLLETEILREVKKTITNAAAVRVLRSGDIDITLPNEAARDRA